MRRVGMLPVVAFEFGQWCETIMVQRVPGDGNASGPGLSGPGESGAPDPRFRLPGWRSTAARHPDRTGQPGRAQQR